MRPGGHAAAVADRDAMSRASILWTVFLFAACGTSSVIEESHKYRDLGQFDQAYALLDRARREAGEASLGSDFDRELHNAHIDFLIDRGRQRIFAERVDAGLADLAEALADRPGDPAILSLQRRAFQKKANTLVEAGEQHLLDRDLRDALESFMAAEKVVPGFKPAIEGLDKVKEALALLSERAQEQFLEAVRKLPEFRFVEVRWHADNALFNAPGREDAEELRRRMQHEIAMKTVARAKRYEQENQFGAALMEYKGAFDLEPGMVEVQDDIARMRNELTAASLYDKAKIDIERNAFDLARQRLALALEKSTLTKDKIQALLLEVRHKEGEQHYVEARDLEILGKKREALAAFEALAKDWPDAGADTAARIESLHTDIAGAEAAWTAGEAAEAAGELQKALDAYESAERYYPGWPDAADRIARLRAKLAEPAGGTPPAGTGGGTEGS